MNKKLIVIISLLFVLLCGMLVFVFWDPIIDWLPIDQSGWEVLDNGGQCYLDEDGDPITGWQELDGNIYYFDPDSFAMQIRWVTLEDGRYYLGDDGVRRTGWQTINDKRYYLGESGAMVTGWLEQPAGMMYLNAQGNPHTGWLELSDGTYYLDENSIRQYGWLELGENRHYLDEDGRLHTGWLEMKEGKYHLNEEGIPQTGWQTIEGNVYYLNETGIMQTGWLELDGNKYYLCGDGTRYTGWLELDGSKYYLKDDGSVAKGMLVIDEKTYFFTSTGANIIMVNTWFEVPEDYEVELVKLPNGKLASAECYDALMQMVDDCTAAGCHPDIIGAHRTVGAQQSLFNSIYQEYKDKGYGDAWSRTLKRCAKPGTSEHHLGLAFDITDKRYPQQYTGTDNAVAWLSKHCHEYGFIVRYPDSKTHITGIMSEPWHFRYVGVEAATYIMENGICFEEFLALYED